MITEFDIDLPGGRVLHGYDTRPGDGDSLAVVWHHGTPNIGTPPRPLIADAERLDMRWVSYDRPGYGGSTPVPDRSVGSAGADVGVLTDHLGIDRFAVMGHSGGATHALASAALMPERVEAVVAMAALAPYTAAGLDWFEGMGPAGVATLRAAAAGRAAKERFEASVPDDAAPDFVPSDLATLSGPWGWLGSVVGPALAHGPAALIDDDLAYVNPWGFDPRTLSSRTLVLHGADDLIVPVGHGRWLAAHIPAAVLVVVPEAGHLAVLERATAALEWIRAPRD